MFILNPRVGEMDHQVRGYIILAEDPSSILSIHIKHLKATYTSIPKEPDAFFWPPWTPALLHTRPYIFTRINIIKS